MHLLYLQPKFGLIAFARKILKRTLTGSKKKAEKQATS